MTRFIVWTVQMFLDVFRLSAVFRCQEIVRIKENVLGTEGITAMLGPCGGVRGLASRRASPGGVAACYDTRMLRDPGCKFFSLHTCVY